MKEEKSIWDDIISFGIPGSISKSVFMKIEKIIRVKKIWHNLDLKVKYCYKIIKTLVSMNSQVSHNLVSSEFRIKREKNGFQFIATLHELVVKTVRKEKGEKKKEKLIDLILISLLRWTWTWEIYVMEIFVGLELSIH